MQFSKRRKSIVALITMMAMVFTMGAGIMPTYGEDGQEPAATEGVKQAVQYGDVTYPDLKAALEAVNATDEEADVLVLLEDVDLTPKAEEDATAPTAQATDVWDGIINKTVTIDLKGHKITGAKEGALLATPEGNELLSEEEAVKVTLQNSDAEKAGVIENTFVKEESEPAAPAEGEEPAETPAPTAVSGNFVLDETVQVTDAEGQPKEDWAKETKLEVSQKPAEQTEQDPAAQTTEPTTEPAEEEVTEPEETYKLTVKTVFNGKVFSGIQTISIGSNANKCNTAYTSSIGPTTASKYNDIKKGEEITLTNPATKCYGCISIKVNGEEVGGAPTKTLTIEEDTEVVVTYGKTGKFICIDPGHGGSDPGASLTFWAGGEKYTYTEKARMWVLSERLINNLNHYPNIVAVCTRANNNICPGVVERGASSKGYDLFISMHSNASSDHRVDYPLVIYPIETSYRNAVYGLASALGATIRTTLNTKDNYQVWSKKNDSGKNWYGVIRGAASVGTPGIIIEHSFNTNQAVAQWLISDGRLQIMANNETIPIVNWVNSNVWSSPATAATTAIASDIKIYDYNYPGNLMRGTAFNLAGTVSSKSGIKRVEVGIVSGSSYVSGHYYNATGLDVNEFSLANANGSLNFQTLPPGNYYCRVWVHNNNGAVTMMMNRSFSVVTPAPTIKNYTAPSSIKKGKGFGIKGTISSSTVINRVEIGVVSKSTGRWMSYAKYDNRRVNAYSFNIANADSTVRFRQLPKGTYYYRIWVHNSYGAHMVINKQFTVK